jgi:hypothetical protein
MFSVNHISINISIGNKTLTGLFSEWFNQLRIVDTLAEKYNIDRDELIEVIQECLNGSSPTISLEFKTEEAKIAKVTPPDNIRCKYIIYKGKNCARRCSKTISKDSIQFCCLHKKYDVIVENKEMETTKLKKRKVSADDTGTLMDQQGIAYYKEPETDILWAVGRKKKPDSFKIVPLGSRGTKKLIKTFSSFEHNDIPPIFKVAELEEENEDNPENLCWINMLIESQRDENTLEAKEDWKDWIQTEYLRMREKCLSGMEHKPFYGIFEIKMPNLPDNFELECIDTEYIEGLHEANLTKEKGFDLGDTQETMFEFIKCLKENLQKARRFRYKSGLAYIYYEVLAEKEKDTYLSSLVENKNFLDVLYQGVALR